MKIHCLFVVRDDRSGVELLEAWDEYSVDENFEGWKEACKTSLTPVLLDGVLKHGYIDIEVDEGEIDRAMDVTEIPGKVL